MFKTVTPFNSKQHHIYLEVTVTDSIGIERYAIGILDTGAPKTEFSDIFLRHIGFIDEQLDKLSVPLNQQTLKYHKINLPSIEICGHKMYNSQFIISSFEKSWGIDVLIGLDFFRKYKITIDFFNEIIIAELNKKS